MVMQKASNKQYGFKSKQSTKICFSKHFKKETDNKQDDSFCLISTAVIYVLNRVC